MRFSSSMRSLVIVRNGELRVVIYALFRYYSNFITKYLVISLEPKETKFWTLVELFHKGFQVGPSSISQIDFFVHCHWEAYNYQFNCQYVYNKNLQSRKKRFERAQTKKGWDVTVNSFFVKPFAIKIPRIILLRIHIFYLCFPIQPSSLFISKLEESN